MNKWDKIKADILTETPMISRWMRVWLWFNNYNGCTEITKTFEIPGGEMSQTYVTYGIQSNERVVFFGRLYYQ